ncbi:glycosyltransferase family 4 protein [Melissococcus plutonius]|uniref:Glycosyl transferase, group 1 family protein n=2 Tax=Melissococcus plutonius TaxID=33970 RepID=A0A2Z5Y3Q4_9ENTE|nr:glycosyltransferase family 4 protein [Melissococcus plutonius]MCV2498520.1 glycosyltransferase family 4 protein [Melissococcus plutonius]MCV2501079.1 glycosyltransferase family 4 protein [Melissococcus plutonius]MCV2504811.1 glycosyltransferase family 4 protein [Melissococcus plutonius]MCV2507272.1 glycosyltransferase family 4 protein [Melissococcus plutonius]MCV2519227.1 glycosyltransferase family 4 protein [Melissococcus plutonius]
MIKTKKDKKHLLVISQYFYPEQFRINDMCEEWIKRGYKVTVVTGIPNYPEGRFFSGYNWLKRRKEKYKGIDIIRIPLIPRGNHTVMLILNYLSFVLSGFFWAHFTKIEADKVFIYEVSPMTQALLGIWYAKRKKIDCYIYVMDLWPENIESITGIKNPLIIGLLSRMVHYIYKNSSKIFTASKSFIGEIKKRKIEEERLVFLPQYAEDFYIPQKSRTNEILLDDRFNLTFAGNIGEAQGLNILPDVACVLKQNNLLIRFNIIGDGRYKKQLIKEIELKSISEYFNFIDKKPAKEIPYYLANSDAALISLAKSSVFDKTIPAKTQSYLACGIPIIVSADGEIQEVIKEAKAGFIGDSGDVSQFVTNIRKMICLTEQEKKQLGKNAYQYYQSNFAKEKVFKLLDNYMGEK